MQPELPARTSTKLSQVERARALGGHPGPVSGGGFNDRLLVHYPPTLQLSNLVNSLEGVSSRLVREDRPEITGRYRQGVLWSPSYLVALCGGAPIPIIRQNIEQQRKGALPPGPKRPGIGRDS